MDLVYCDDPHADAETILSQAALLRGVPVVVRYVETAEGSKSRRQAIEACRRASLVLVSGPVAEQQLLSAGLDRQNVLRAVQVHGCSIDRSPEARRAARQVLAEANHDLFARSQDRVLVCPGELTAASGVGLLIRELSPLIDEHRWLRVWILGDSRERPAIYELLQHEGLHRLVAMPGIFTDLTEVFQAADLCVFPTAGLGFGWLIPTCIANSIPVLVNDSPEARRLLGDQANELTVRFDLARELRGRVGQWLLNPQPLAQSIASLRRYSVSGTATSCLSVADFMRKMEAIAHPHA
jgi:glycosyltransferase involved in cell wall biosynthesis